MAIKPEDLDLSNVDHIHYIRQRPWFVDELRIRGIEVPAKLTDPNWTPEDGALSDDETLGLYEDSSEQDGQQVVEDDEQDSEQDDDVVDYEDYTVDELKAELAERGIPASGKKADLIAALEEDDADKQEENA